MKTKQIIGFIIAVSMFTLCGIASVLSNTLSQSLLSDFMTGTEKSGVPEEPYIAVVEVSGTIQEQAASTSFFETEAGYQHQNTLEYIDSLIEDSNNAAILLYVDSPGGAVYESEELYDKLKEYSELTERPIWTYMAHYAASGGYMISVASDKIYANPNTVTGSIGVIMSGYDLTGLYEKLGIRYVSITSGVNKDSSQLTDAQIDIYQSQVDECYESFVQKVADGRNLTMEEVKLLADGRTYTAKQALEHALIDQISSYDDMVDEMCASLNVSEIYQPEPKENILASFFATISHLVPKSESQILLETAEQMESGVLMYYAE